MELLNKQFAYEGGWGSHHSPFTIHHYLINLESQWQWSSIIDLKAQELANYLLGKRKNIDFTTPSFKLDRIDNKELRDKILVISYKEWKELGYSKGSLHQLKQKAKSNKPFKLYGKMKEKVENV